jgi:hypothetical protein
MAKKLTLEDLKVQSFVTTLNAHQADQLVGATAGDTDCFHCTMTHCGECTNMGDSNCCEGGGTGINNSICCDSTSVNCITTAGCTGSGCFTEVGYPGCPTSPGYYGCPTDPLVCT